MDSPHSFSIMLSRSSCILLTLLALVSHSVHGSGEVISLNQGNINNILATHEVVLVNFYADWCRFSQMLTPIFEETSKKVMELYPEPGRVALAKVDCDKESSISTEYHISKYPTLKLFRNGQAVKKEYRGQRSAEAMAQYIGNQVKDTVQRHDTLEKIYELEENKRNVIGYFNDEETDTYKTFRRASSQLRDDCQFHAALGEVSAVERTDGEKVLFRPPMTRQSDEIYEGDLTNYDALVQWAQNKCVPLIRQITFENAEELTEEGLPFLILFHKLDDTDIVEAFNRAVTNEILAQKKNYLSTINFLTADGTKFSHPLHHLGKTVNDLPILAIDSFRHMYLFKNDVRTDLEKPGVLLKFVEDLHSGKLHREFHHGPDPAGAPSPPVHAAQPNIIVVYADGYGPSDSGGDAGTPDQPHPVPDMPDAQNAGEQRQEQQPSTPPESTFRRLKPSENRYTILDKDEL